MQAGAATQLNSSLCRRASKRHIVEIEHSRPIHRFVDHPLSSTASYSERMRPSTASGLRPRDAPPVLRQRNTLPASPRIRSPRGFRPQEHHQPSCIVVYVCPRRPAARLPASASLYSAVESALRDRRHRSPPTPVLRFAPFQSIERQSEPTSGSNHPPEAPHEALRPSTAPPPTTSLLDQ